MTGGAIVVLVFVLAIIAVTVGLVAYSVKAGAKDDDNEALEEV